jgi:hypothetical protein
MTKLLNMGGEEAEVVREWFTEVKTFELTVE